MEKGITSNSWFDGHTRWLKLYAASGEGLLNTYIPSRLLIGHIRQIAQTNNYPVGHQA